MGCEQSTPVANEGNVAARHSLKGIGQTERQISKMQRAAMNNQKDGESDDGTAKTPPKLDQDGFLMAEEVAKRTFSSISNKEVTLGTMANVSHLQFAHWTQRGYYPDDPHKQNQDEFGTHLQFGGVDRDAMFAVYDGHGKHGHACARFARDRLPKAITKHVRKVRCQKYQKSSDPGKKGWDPAKWPMLNRKEYESCCRKAFLEVNQAMHDSPSVVDSLSGTTATTVNFHGSFVSVCNVGDSRVVLGHRVRSPTGAKHDVSVHYPVPAAVDTRDGGGEEEKTDVDDEVVYESTRTAAVALPVIPPGLSFESRQRTAPGTRVLAIPLSKDQTPYRKDERDRVKAQGAAIMSIDQMQGKEELHDDWGDLVLGETLDLDGDSPRVWVDGRDYPGCAFTRSLGDSLSESIGVTGVPEMVSMELTQNDEYLVIASDGIFEFLTNQVVIDLCTASESPLVACEKIVKAAYQQWLTYESRTDDITIVVCFLQNFKSPIDGTNGTTEELVETFGTIYGERPRHMSPLSESNAAIALATQQLIFEEADQTAPRSTGTRSIADEEGDEVHAYVSEEAEALIVRSTTPPPAPMRFDDEEDEDNYEDAAALVIRSTTPPPISFDNTDVVEGKIDSLLNETNGLDNVTSRTASVTTVEDDDPNISIIDHGEDKIDKVALQTTGSDERDSIQV